MMTTTRCSPHRSFVVRSEATMTTGEGARQEGQPRNPVSLTFDPNRRGSLPQSKARDLAAGARYLPHLQILLDAQNFSSAGKSSTKRDAEAVQLLLVRGSANYKDFIYEPTEAPLAPFAGFDWSARCDLKRWSVRLLDRHQAGGGVLPPRSVIGTAAAGEEDVIGADLLIHIGG
ncbi:hypothetical protein IEQ34_011313 [Dendrobium chrysotoxum]|uniref:Uncharacterized protein n=1 Tax=Dendrobium chrysotoxum TaxID=161865 RepID=A0AAV7GFR6_DENCH|nr:hypothetical protein IEQ34_011313 [Dendrobium chrysotoxum]